MILGVYVWLTWTASAVGEPAALLREAAAEEIRQEALRAPFVYRERQRNWSVEKAGKKKSDRPWLERVYEHIFLEGEPYKQLIEKNGQPIAGAERQKQESARQAEAARRRESRKLRRPFLPGTRRIQMGTLSELAEAYHLKDAGEEVVDGIACRMIDAEPNGRKDTPRNQELQSYRQRLWIATEGKQLVKRRVEVFGPDSEILPSSVITFTWAPLDGVWFEKRREIEFGAKVFRVRTNRGLQIHEYYDYRRFAVESTITPADPPQ